MSVPERVVGDVLSIMAIRGRSTTVTIYSANGQRQKETLRLPTPDGRVNVFHEIPSGKRYIIESTEPIFVSQLTKSKDTYKHNVSTM